MILQQSIKSALRLPSPRREEGNRFAARKLNASMPRMCFLREKRLVGRWAKSCQAKSCQAKSCSRGVRIAELAALCNRGFERRSRYVIPTKSTEKPDRHAEVRTTTCGQLSTNLRRPATGREYKVVRKRVAETSSAAARGRSRFSEESRSTPPPGRPALHAPR